MIGRRKGLLRLGATASAWLACSAVATAASAAVGRDGGGGDGGAPRPTGPVLPDDGRPGCPLCSRGLDCTQHVL